MVVFLKRSSPPPLPSPTEAAQAGTPTTRRPFLLRFRSSTGFIALAVGFGVLVDLSSYALAVPVIPFRLQSLGYDNIGGKTGWLVAAYAGGLIVSSPPAAWIGAKWKNRQIPLSFGLLFMAGAVIMFMEAKSYTLMVVARILQGFSGTFLWTIGLALVTDSVPEQRVGVVLGQVMIGFSLGQAIGPPVGGTMYDRLGYRAPFVFSIILVAIDLLLRLFIIEKRQALKYIAEGHRIEGFEAPGYSASAAAREGEGEEEGDRTRFRVPLSQNTPEDVELREKEQEREHERESGVVEQDQAWEEQPKKKEKPNQPARTKRRIPDELVGFLHLMADPRAACNLYISLMNGFIVGGLLDTGMTIYLENEYGLSSLGAGVVFLGVVVPTFFASPLAGWVTDKYGTKWIMALGVLLSVPAYPLLIIKGPLALFVFFLVLIGISVSFFLTPVTVDLAICAAETPSIHTAQVFGMFNLAFSIGSFVGPIIGGQILAAVSTRKAWAIIASIAAGLTALALPLVVLFVGGRLGVRQRMMGGGKASVEKGKEGGGEGA
ncbi:hypothetical protein JCM11641_001076 [Rhodosporidiobolus odoratus]